MQTCRCATVGAIWARCKRLRAWALRAAGQGRVEHSPSLILKDVNYGAGFHRNGNRVLIGIFLG